jgi:aconitate hydratase
VGEDVACAGFAKLSRSTGQGGLQASLDKLGFNLVGYGCTTCIGNSGPLPEEISKAITQGDLVVSSVLSGNRNFEGRVHQEVRTNWLASPPLVVAYAIAGTMRIDCRRIRLAKTRMASGVPEGHLAEQQRSGGRSGTGVADMFERQYADVFTGRLRGRRSRSTRKATYGWENSTYIKQPPFFKVGDDLDQQVEIRGARILALLGDSVTTDHISPAGEIQPDSPAGHYLRAARRGRGGLQFVRLAAR